MIQVYIMKDFIEGLGWNSINQSDLILLLVAMTSPLVCLLSWLHSFGPEAPLLLMRRTVHWLQGRERIGKNKKVHFLLLNL